jgi:hypothetical protein
MRLKSIKFFLLILFVFANINLFSIEIINDNTNIRKFFFNKETNWDIYDGKKKFYNNNSFGLICFKYTPKYIEKDIFDTEIILKLNLNNKTSQLNLLLKNYELNNKTNTYVLKNELSVIENKKITDILKTIEFTKFDYFFVFYNVDPELEKKYKPFDPDLMETYTTSRITYLFNYSKELLEVKFYYQNKNNSFAYFNRYSPNKFDVYLFGKPVRLGLPYHFGIDSLKYLSVASIYALFDINKISDETLITKNDKEIKDSFINKIILPSTKLNYRDDGAINEFGEYVFILSEQQQTGEKGVNCSGFVKDVIDNYIRLKIKSFKWLSIGDLKKKREEERSKIPYTFFEEKNDPFFGLEWATNLADKINEYYDYKYIKAEFLNNDNYAKYFESSGYYVSDLKEILFRDQKNDSKYFYILIFNKLKDTTPVMPVFYHMAIVVPYFENNHFYIRVFESTKETDYENISKYHNDKATIIKVPIPIVEITKE